MLTLLLSGTFSFAALSAQDSLNLSSDITGATVFLEGAQVQRTTDYRLPPGRTTLILTGLTAELDPGSIQVTALEERLTVLSVRHRLNFGGAPTATPESDRLAEELDRLQRREDAIRTRVKITTEEEAILKANRAVAGQETGIDFDQLRATIEYQRERLTAIGLYRLAAGDTLRQIADARESLQQQRAELGTKQVVKATSEVIVEVAADGNLSGKINLAYLVREAGWQPLYDVRVADISRPVDLRYRAKVHQETGEDWSDIRLKLSTGDPSATTIAPTLSTWRMSRGSAPPSYRPQARQTTEGNYQRMYGHVLDDEGMPLIGVSVYDETRNIGTVTDIDGYYELQLPLNARQLTFSYTGFESSAIEVRDGQVDVRMQTGAGLLDEVVVTGYAGNSSNVRSDKSSRGRSISRSLQGKVRGVQIVESAPVPVSTVRQATTVTFDIDLPYTIPTDGKPREVEIQRYALPAVYTHFAVPKFEPVAYLQAAVTGWDRYDLLPGEANLFFEGTYLGLSQLAVSNTNDTLKIDLGQDPNVTVERKETEDYRERNLLGNRITESRGYTLSVRNKKAQAINLIVQDQAPISGDEQIDIKTEVDPAGVLEEETGIITWRVNLPPAQAWKGTFGYTVKRPRYLSVYLE